MPVWLSALLGITQGLTEFLPVSSSGHLVILQSLFSGIGQTESWLFFDLMLHLGTVIAVMIAFWSDIVVLIKAFFSMAFDRFRIRGIPERRFIVMILVSMIPVLFAVPFMDRIDAMFSSSVVVGPALLVTAALLLISDRASHGNKNEKNAGYKSAFFIGLMQLAAVIPGVSRSGATITGGMLNHYSKDFAVRFSFIMSLPIILGANILSLPEALSNAGNAGQLPTYLIGVTAACISGLFAIKAVRYLVRKKGLWPFAIYCIVVGTGVIIFNIF